MIYVTLALCVLGASLLVYRYDMYEREPWYMLLIAALAGAGMAWAIGFVEDWIIEAFGRPGHTIVYQSAIAATCEELCKLLVVAGIMVCCRRHFNDPMDGIIYGAFAGIGFATEESLFYIDLLQQAAIVMSWQALLGQETIRVFLHLLTGGMDGFGFGLARFRVPYWRTILPTWILASVGIHFLWDYACGMPQDGEVSPLFQRGVAIFLMLFGTGLFGVAVFVGNRWSRTVHPPVQPSDHQQLVRWPFSLLIRSRKTDSPPE